MSKSCARILFLMLLAAVPAVALDFNASRHDSSGTFGTSVGQQTSHQANAFKEHFLDPAGSSWAVYWKNELQNAGGNTSDTNTYTNSSGTVATGSPFGDNKAGTGPTAAIRDNRDQERTIDWNTWTATQAPKKVPAIARPQFTPNVPQAWSPVEVDLDNSGGQPDHLLIGVSFTQPQVGDTTGGQDRDQILNAWYPQMAAGLPGNAAPTVPPRAASDQFTVRPLWLRNNDPQKPGIRIADLAPVRADAASTTKATVGVVTQPPIFARVPAIYEDGSGTPVTENIPVVYLVVGTGEGTALTGDFARVICVALRKPGYVPTPDGNGRPLADKVKWLPDPTSDLSGQTDGIYPTINITDSASGSPADTDYIKFNGKSIDVTNSGMVMWSYTVKDRASSTNPTPVAGISFANIGDSSDSRPTVYVTTGDGQLIALNGKAVDTKDTTEDGDPAILNPANPPARWIWKTPQITTTFGGLGFEAGFPYGMAPAVARTPLNSMFSGSKVGTFDTSTTVTNASGKYNVSEWMVFVADTNGCFRAFDAPGAPVLNGTQITSWSAQKRWADPPDLLATPMSLPVQLPRLDPQNNVERFIVPPLVYQGATPLLNSSGGLIPGSSDVGFDDEVVFASEKGDLYAFDAIGRLTVGGGNDGEPTQRVLDSAVGSDPRWKWPTDDTALTAWPATDEPRPWPRTLPLSSDYPNPPPATNVGQATAFFPSDDVVNAADTAIDPTANTTQYNALYVRGALAVGYGGNTDPDGPNPNLDQGMHNIFVPYIQDTNAPAALDITGGQTAGGPFYEYVGSLKPYGFIQLSQGIAQLLPDDNVPYLSKSTVVIGGKTRKIPLNRMRVGTVKSTGVTSDQITSPAPALGATQTLDTSNPAVTPPEDTVYFVSPTWYDEENNEWVTMPLSGSLDVTIVFDSTTAQNQTETQRYPSYYRLEYTDFDPLNPATGHKDITKTQVHHVRASLGEAFTRLELRRLQKLSTGLRVIQDEAAAQVDPAAFDYKPVGYDPMNLTAFHEGLRPPSMLASGTIGIGGTVLAPTWFRGRVIGLNQRLKLQRVVHGCYDPRMDPNISATFGNPTLSFGPSYAPFTYDPGEFYDPTSTGTANGDTPFLDDEPLLTDVGGGSVTVVDGWAYIMYANGHLRGYSNVGGGAGGTVTGSNGQPSNPPLFQPPPTTTGGGNVVKAPGQFLDSTGKAAGGIHLATDKNALNNPFGVTWQDQAGNPDKPLLLEWGQTVYIIVDYGPADSSMPHDRGNIIPPQTAEAPNGSDKSIDGQILQYDVQGQIRSSNGAVQQLPGLNRGVRPVIRADAKDTSGFDHVVAVVPIFAGMPSATNPLTPGTPLLSEKPATDPSPPPAPQVSQKTFQGELTYDIQVTQQGVQWLWPDPTTHAYPADNKTIDPKRQHYWEIEPNQGATRFPTTAGTTAGTPNWKWADATTLLTNERAPLVSYNNPIAMNYNPGGVVVPHGIPGTGSSGTAAIWSGADDTIALVNSYDNHLDKGRKNGDPYVQAYVDGAHSGSGTPLVPVVGVGYKDLTASATPHQLIFADHGASSPASSTLTPNQGKVYFFDRSHLGFLGKQLTLKVQTAPLTKMGKGAQYGFGSAAALGNVGGANGPNGSFEQNAKSYDDAPGGAYSSMAPNRIQVFKSGTNLDLKNGPVPVAGRDPALTATNGLPPVSNGQPDLTRMDAFTVSVDVPRYTADDIYTTRWRTTTPQGADPTQAFNPFFNPLGTFSFGGENGRPLWDQAEQRSQPNYATTPTATATYLDDPSGTPPDPNESDRTRRIVVFNDANGNGQLDLLPNYREAYRTFAVQVVVKPDMKLQAAQSVVDIGAEPQGKKAPGTGTGANEIREWQELQVDLGLAAGTPEIPANPALSKSIGQFRQQYWRQFNVLNTGNVNLAYLKPELIYQAGSGPQILALTSEGNDPWRALTLINLPGGGSQLAPAQDPRQIFLRTSFDDQLFPDSSIAYGAQGRGVWLQKAAAGAGAPGASLYVDPNSNISGSADKRDPSIYNFVNARPSWMSLNVPAGSPLGQFSGNLRFYNDRAVEFVEDPQGSTSPLGYYYRNPNGTVAKSGTLERDPNSGQPLEPATSPAFKIKVKVTEGIIHGRYDLAKSTTQDQPDRRFMPAAAPDISQTANGQVRGLLLAYASDRANLTGANKQPGMFDLFGTRLSYDQTMAMFPFQELPLNRPPWLELFTNNYGWSALSNVAAAGMGTQISKPSMYQDPTNLALLSWIERRTPGQGNNEYRIYYSPLGNLSNNPPILLSPGGQVPDLRSPKTGVRVVNSGGNWFTFFAQGTGSRNNIEYSWTTNANVGNGQSWSPELTLPTSPSLTTVNDPYVFATDAISRASLSLPAIPPLAWLSHSGTSQRLGKTDVYLQRYLSTTLATAVMRGTTNPKLSDNNYGLMEFPRTENDILVANPTRTLYAASGADWKLEATTPTLAQVYIARPDIAGATQGSLANPIPLIDQAKLVTVIQNAAPNTQEIMAPLSAAAIALGGNTAQLQNARVLIDKAAGTVRFTMDTRTLARVLTPSTAMANTSPDPVVTADYTPSTLRVTRGDVSGSNPTVVPVLTTDPNDPAMDASWYRQQIDGTKWASGTPVAGEADRLWVLWRRSAGAVTGGPTCYYKVLRPGVRVKAGALWDISTANLKVTVNGNTVTPEEVNPQTGMIFLPMADEGQKVQVQYLPGPQAASTITENHVCGWKDESGERPVPMDTSVNEGSMDAFVSYERVGLTALGSNSAPNGGMLHMEKIWMFWGSTRGSGGDLFYGTLAPRIGPDVNLGGSATLYAAAFRGSPSARFVRNLAGLSPKQQAEIITATETNRPPVLPPIYRRGPYIPMKGSNAQARSR